MTHDSKPSEFAQIDGLSGSAGFAVGQAFVVDTGRLGVVHRKISLDKAQSEVERYRKAVDEARQELQALAEQVRESSGSSAAGVEASILDAYILMVGDQTLLKDVERGIRDDLHGAEWALESAVAEMCATLRESKNHYLAERSHDFEFVRDRILRCLTGQKKGLVLPTSGEPVILVAHDLSPAETAALNKRMVLGLICEVGTRTSHTAILARALEIPAVVGAHGALEKIANGEQLVLDGVHGKVIVEPSAERLRELQPQAERYYALARGLRERRDEPAVLADGLPIQLQSNIELILEAELAKEQGAQGIGLYRTEFLYIDRQSPPSEEEQYEAYRQVVEAMAPLPVTLRTFDIGGDKFVSTIKMPQDMNPALGLRAVRLGLSQPELFKTQLRAMIRASAHGSIKIMVPMVSSLSELRAVRALLAEAVLEVDRHGHAHAEHIALGCMIEIPSAAILAEEFAREADFLSIGTNDLVQYTLAVDRTSRELARLASYFDPAVIRLIKQVIQAGKFRKRDVSVCGTMASDPLAAILLVGMGLRSLSMEASALPEVKAALKRVSRADAEDAADTAFEATTAQELEQGIAQRFAPLLADILDPE
ncbi:MAG: phosphoenolpyruvate--protein phosphotransferase [Polyangiaceae bacterium]|nr:phosphoenolpyruvate--protein phosphotransferase [Polyangiaceae bacterium]